MKVKRIVVDSNVLLSPANKSRRVLDAVVAEGRFLFLEEAAEFADFMEVDGEVLGCADPDDDEFLEMARNGQAEVIITGDKDLLAMHPFDGFLCCLQPTG